jgi:CHASE3 domain sensor protein
MTYQYVAASENAFVQQLAVANGTAVIMLGAGSLRRRRGKAVYFCPV